MYRVFFRTYDNPADLEDWLNEKESEGLYLQAVDNGYFIFRQSLYINRTDEIKGIYSLSEDLVVGNPT